MIFALDDLSKKSLIELRDIFSAIPLDDNEIILEGDFNQTKLFESPLAAKALSYLPKHVTMAKFGGTYVYTRHSYERRTGTRFQAGGGGEIATYTTVWYSIRHVGGLLVNFITSLPTSVNALFLNFQYRREDLELRLGRVDSNVPNSFKEVFKKIPSQIKYFDLMQTWLTEDSDQYLRISSIANHPPLNVRRGKIAAGANNFRFLHPLLRGEGERF